MAEVTKKPATKAATKTTTKVAEKPATKTAPKAAPKTAAKPATKAAPKTTAKVAEKPATKTTTAPKAELESKVVAVKTEIKKTASKKPEYNGPKLKITLIKSTIGALEKQKRTIVALGLRKIRSSVVKRDDVCTRGMIFVVRHLVSVEEVK